MTAPVVYTRVVAGFSTSVAPAAVDAVIDLARVLGAELQAVLLEDLATLGLAQLPSPRAFDPREAIWRDVSRGDVQQQLDLAASMLRRRLATAQSSGLRAQMAVESGGARPVLGLYAHAGDLLVVTEPTEAMARWAQPFAGLLDAALATPAALLYLPHQGARRRGPVAALGAGVNAALARRLAQALGAPCFEAEAAPSPAGARSLRALLPQLQERRVRLVVCSRAALGVPESLTLHEAGDRRLAVLLAPSEEGG